MQSNWCHPCYISSDSVHWTMMAFFGSTVHVSGKVHNLPRAYCWKNAYWSTCWQVQNKSRIRRRRDRIIWIKFHSTHHGSHCSSRGFVWCQEGFFHWYRCWQGFDIFNPLRSLHILLHVTRSKHIILRFISILRILNQYLAIQFNSIQLNSNDNDAIFWSCSNTLSPQRPTQRKSSWMIATGINEIVSTMTGTLMWCAIIIRNA